MTQTEDGNVNWETTTTEGLLDVERAETQIADGIRQQLNVEAVVDCGEPRFRVSNIGDTFECSAKAGDDQATVRVEVISEDGNMNWSM